MTPVPLRWIGGKTRLLPVIRQYLPPTCKNYFEPFVGGGALFFDYGYKAEKAYLNDICAPLMDTYWYLSRNFKNIEECLFELMETSYEVIRSEFNESYQLGKEIPCVKGNAEQVARFIALNHLCFNGIWRENKQGGMNVPVGKVGKKPMTRRVLTNLNFERLQEAADLLRNAICISSSFSPWPFDTEPQTGDVEFNDPPYLEEFSQYNKSGFTAEDHQALATQAKAHAANGATVIVCGSNNTASWDIYGSPTHVVELSRTVGHSKRGKATEALYVFTEKR